MVTKTPHLPTRNHYVPQFYLRGFSQDGKFIYQLDKVTQKIELLPISKVCVKKNLYTYKSINGTTESLESLFSQLEDLAAQIIRKLENKEEITPQERSDLAIYISMQMLRTIAFKKKLLSSLSELTEKVMRMSFRVMPTSHLQTILAKMGHNISEIEAKQLKEFATDEKRSKLEISFPNEYWQRHMLKLGVDLSKVFYFCDWTIHQSITQFGFITSDHPYMLVPGEKPHPFFGVGMLTPKAKKIVPLSAKICLIAHDPSKKPSISYMKADKGFFRMINKWTVGNAERFVFSSHAGKLEKIVKQNKDLLKTPLRYRVS